jgi:hypothetical protein
MEWNRPDHFKEYIRAQIWWNFFFFFVKDKHQTPVRDKEDKQ